MCEDRQVVVNASDASYVSLDRVEETWPGWMAVKFRSGCASFS